MSQAKRPMNVLFLFPDQWRWDYLGCEPGGYGGPPAPVSTPNIDRLAARGTMFHQCRVNSPVCAPSRACLVQGVRYDRCGVPSNAVNTDESRPTYMKRLRDAGYHVAGSGKFDLFKPEFFRGLEGWTDRLGAIGFTEARNQSGKIDCARNGWPEPQDLYSAHLHRLGLMETHAEDYKARAAGGPHGYFTSAWPTPLPTEDYTDDFCGRMAEELLRGFEKDRPWHLWVNFPGPHNPLDPTAGRLAQFDGVEFPEVVEGEAGIDHQACRRAYAACCLGIDDWVGRLVDAVERRGELDRTLIVFASDHGEMLGDHGRWGKSVPRDPSARVPLIVAGPGVPAGGHREHLVELIDLAATFTHAAGVEPVEGWEARSLWPIISDAAAAHRQVQVSGLGDWRSIVDGRHKLLLRRGGDAELYDLEADPAERVNLAPDPARASTVARLRDALRQEVGAEPLEALAAG